MPEAVIVSTARTAIGRAHKGSLTQVRPDDLAATIVAAAIAKVPALAGVTWDDLMLGCAQPAASASVTASRSSTRPALATRSWPGSSPASSAAWPRVMPVCSAPPPPPAA